MKFKTLALTVLTACLIPAFAQAANDNQSGQRKGPPSPEEAAAHFAKIDTNGDGQLSLNEVQTADDKKLVKRFDKIDTNSDGQLSEDELKAAHPKGPKGGKGDSSDESED
jgi:Ca2+-binding EF-hand superfamily protein